MLACVPFERPKKTRIRGRAAQQYKDQAMRWLVEGASAKNRATHSTFSMLVPVYMVIVNMYMRSDRIASFLYAKVTEYEYQ
ncbi:hypothetical protein GQ55_6G066300 [Panicum hallii var. hallii]|uniref:Uncharacterized protein n=1 Tax=Panicum hallii var. hallii TaxID=1504633 RepID=A0A2T7D4S2_9POAL|nr:hypothetical protein GQ55_6G066300 [Panicum hallii var. hallii]